MILPPEAHDLVQVLGPHFTSPTYQRFSALLVGALVTTGRRTVANLLRTLRHLAPGHPAGYRRVLSRAPWSGIALGCALVRLVLANLVPDGPVTLVGDDTVDGHKGPHVYGKARHRDPVRSTHSYTAFRYGHKWVVLAVLVKFPFAARPWALPVLVDLYRSEEDDQKRHRPHRTPARIMCGLLRLLLLRFPDRAFVFAGDSGYGTHEVARFCDRHRQRLTLVSKLHPDANLFDPPPPYAGKGRPRVKGDRRPEPRQAVAAATTLTRFEVGWYGGGKRTVRALTGTGHWYKAGRGLVPIRWVFVRGTTGTRRDEYFFTTDRELSASAVIAAYCGRWSVEGLFLRLTTVLRCEVNALGYPPAALFGLCVALDAGNVYAGVKGAVRAAHGAGGADGVSDYHLALEVSGACPGLWIAVPAETWVEIGRWPVGRMAEWLVGLARGANLGRYRKATRGPKKPKPPRTRFADAKHIATSRLLNGEQT